MDGLAEHLKASTHYRAQCWTPIPGFRWMARLALKHPWLSLHVPRELAWEEQFDNLVTTAGKNKVLDATFKTGLTTPTWYVGLVNNASFTAYAAADILSSHTGWLESTDYAGNRKTWTPGTIAAGSVDNSGSQAVFAINGTITIRGAFLCDAATGTTGTLYGGGTLPWPGAWQAAIP